MTLGRYSPRDGQHPFFLGYPISVETGVLSIAGGGWGVGDVCNNNGATHLVCPDPRSPLLLTLTDPRGLNVAAYSLGIDHRSWLSNRPGCRHHDGVKVGPVGESISSARMH